ncbi:MAG: AraC family transcriptional regulator ligand-binding domain-containing protein [Pseudomonadota bacterium]
MKRAASIATDSEEMVPNYWLRSLKGSPHLSPDMLAFALREADLEPDILDQPGVMLPLLREVAVVEALAHYSPDPLFALRLGLSSRANGGSVLSYILFASPTLRVGLTNVCTFIRLTRPRSRVQMISTPDHVEFRMGHPEPQVQMAVAYRDFALGSILRSWSTATNTTIHPHCVYIAAPIGKRSHEIARALRCPVEDAKGHTAIIVKHSVLDLPIRSSDELLLQHLTEYGQMLLKERRPEAMTTRERVYRYLLREIPLGVPKVSDAADALALSERTLARRLSEEGTSYRAIVDETRANMAEALLEDPSISLTEISYLLGFSDPSSFSNAYRRWTGQPPISARPPRQISA